MSSDDDDEEEEEEDDDNDDDVFKIFSWFSMKNFTTTMYFKFSRDFLWRIFYTIWFLYLNFLYQVIFYIMMMMYFEFSRDFLWRILQWQCFLNFLVIFYGEFSPPCDFYTWIFSVKWFSSWWWWCILNFLHQVIFHGEFSPRQDFWITKKFQTWSMCFKHILKWMQEIENENQ